ncbi:serine/threonine-protein kinase [Blastococcus xanthinilyticus]|uniref:serine/threonine-protein kinase n=1 Tax=Blastococcus xanthinilyticus TaxID=1564164 RepID=UPI001FB5D303|nr:serine/threonine-protein kinase [Blastococcus xanthinilyticus]
MTTVETSHRRLDDRYELHQLIAVGGMGEVWRGRDALLDRPVAVKLLRSDCAGDPVFIARFRIEARHAAALSHPNIAAVLDYGETTAAGTGEQLAYLVMELVEGEPLSARLAEEGPLDTGTTLSVLRQAAAGLAEAHRAGVVHRDVKPANILVRPDGAVKLTDFGISWSAGSVPLTRTGQVIGTAQYMSPEQAMGEAVSPASDVYALGMVGYESLTGHTAFEGDNPVTVALKQVREHPEPLPADLPPEVRAIIDAALVKDPGERLPDGAAFLHAVEETLDGPAPSTRPVAAATRARPPAARRRSPRAALVALPVLALLGLGAGGIVVLGNSATEDAGGAGTAVSTPAGIRLVAGDHVGRPVADVVDDLTALGLTVRQETEVTAARAPGTVTRVSPTGVELAPGAEVLVRVAARPSDEPAPAPDQPAPVPGADPNPVDPPAGEAPTTPSPTEAEGTTEPPTPSEPADPTPADPTVPPEPTDPPTEPTDPPTDPTDPTAEPTDPTAEPTDPTAEPTDPTAEPTDPTAEPTDPTTEPTDPPTEPTDPTTEPTDPTTPASV